MIYGEILAAAVVFGLGALRIYIRFDERRLADDARRRGDLEP